MMESRNRSVPVDDEMLNTGEAMRLLGVSRAVFYQIVKRENVQRYQAPADRRSMLFKRSDIEALKHPRPVSPAAGIQIPARPGSASPTMELATPTTTSAGPLWRR